MELVRLTIENFRQFHGVQEIEFAAKTDENITVIHGANGSGKTTLLNVFTWMFYDTVTLPQPDSVASFRALAEVTPGDRVTVRSELVFHHEGTQYTFARQQAIERDTGDDLAGTKIDEEVTLEYLGQHGNRKQRSNPSMAIKQIMPKRLREVFFFDGETIDKMVADDQDRVQEAIRNIMGLEILDRAERHLNYVRRKFQSEMEQHGSEEMQELLRNQAQIESNIEQREQELDNVEESRKEASEELDSVDERLETNRESRRLQQKRDQIESGLASIDDDIDDMNDRIGDLTAASGQLPFAVPAIEQTAEMLNEKRQNGEIHSQIKQVLVDDLLERGECICERPLANGSDSRQSVAQYREQAGSTELEEAAMQISGRLSELGASQESFYADLDEALAERSNLKNERRELRETLDEVSDQLKDTDEDIAKLENRREELKDDIQRSDKEIGRIESQIDDLESELSAVQRDITDAEEENELSERANRRTQTAIYLRDRVSGLHEQFQDQVRRSVNDRVNDLYRQILAKDYFIEVSEAYKLEFLRSVKGNPDQTVPVSTGERQVASLAFISSLVSLARERAESDQDSAYFSGGIYPVVMDSPFGALDPEYQEEVSQVVPEMADQVMVMLTDSQWSDEVSGEMGPRAGSEYDLIYHDSDEDGVEYEYTEIRPVARVT